MDGTATLEIKENLKQYVLLTEAKDKVLWFVNPYNGKKFNDPGAMNFDMFQNCGADKRLPQVDIAYLAGLPKIPKQLKTKDTLG